MHNEFAKKLKNLLRVTETPDPVCYLLGKNKKGIVSIAQKLRVMEECEEMPSIEEKVLIRAALRIFKKKLTPCGIARVGAFNYREGARGPSLNELGEMNKDAFLLSYGHKGTEILSYNPEENTVTKYIYKIIQNKKGGETNGKKSRHYHG